MPKEQDAGEADDASVYPGGEGCSGAAGAQMRVERHEHGSVQRVAEQLGYGPSRCGLGAPGRHRRRHAPGVSREEAGGSRRSSRRTASWRANEILKRASAFFGAELDRQHRR